MERPPSFFLAKLKTKGQTTVEYLLLIVVLAALFLSIYPSLQVFFAEDGNFLENVAKRIENTYRNTLYVEANGSNLYSDRHPSFFDTAGDKTRFFGGVHAYP